MRVPIVRHIELWFEKYTFVNNLARVFFKAFNYFILGNVDKLVVIYIFGLNVVLAK